jgi:ATP-dependent helicase/nuclease subunit A
VARALASPTIAWAGTRRYHQELMVVAPAGAQGVFEGFVDLVVEDEDSLVVVDYKTDRLEPRTREAVLERHRRQVAAYAEALTAASGRPVRACVLVLLAGEAAEELVVEGEELARGQAQAAAFVSEAGRATV